MTTKPECTKHPAPHKYTEAWLDHAVELMRPYFAERGYEIPRVRVLPGFSTNGYHPERRVHTLASCHPRSWSKDGINEIYISPLTVHPVEVLSILAHELIHAINDCQDGHGPVFQEMSRSLHLPSNRRVDISNRKLAIRRFREMAQELGPFPRGGVSFSENYLDEEILEDKDRNFTHITHRCTQLNRVPRNVWV